MTPAQFIAKWQAVNLSERSACQQHFLDLCELLGQPKPAEADPEGAWYCFEKGVKKTAGGDGWADVWMQGRFGWEYKGKHKDLVAAYRQLLQYREALENPPLLVVCDLDRFEIHTNFTGTIKKVFAFDLSGLAEPDNLNTLRRLFTEPEALRPGLTTQNVTEQASALFGRVADGIRQLGIPPHSAAHFLMKLMFCMFAEDIDLLPEKVFTRSLAASKKDPGKLTKTLKNLFEAMASGGSFGADEILYFNGGLFADAEVIELIPAEIATLSEAAQFDWSDVEPHIFGTLFERLLDPAKRSQIGAHYTSREDITTLLEPVMMAPLRRQWSAVQDKVNELRPKLLEGKKKGGKTLSHKETKTEKQIKKLLHDFGDDLAQVTVLDPACGSGNFLYVALHLLLDLNKEVVSFAAKTGLGMFPQVNPTQLLGIEINPYAAELAQVVIWIGYLQWMHDNGFTPNQDPVLQDFQSIQQKDAILDLSDPENPKEPEWPKADYIVGNPPFLGDKLMRGGIGDNYVDCLRKLYSNRIPGQSDLCCYWFERARVEIVAKKSRRAGLLATQGIRGGQNRVALERIKESLPIFWAVSDRNWVLDGAMVHVSMVGFGDAEGAIPELNGAAVDSINVNLTSAADTTGAVRLVESSDNAFIGVSMHGPFEITESQAIEFLRTGGNVGAIPNSDIVRPIINATGLGNRGETRWVIAFRPDSELDSAARYEAPLEYVKKVVKPVRDENRRKAYRDRWWIHGEARPAMQEALQSHDRILITPRVSKHRVFVWISPEVLPSDATVAFSHADDFTFGVLQSHVHELWALAQGTQLREKESGFRYTPSSCFETFPFPEPTDKQRQAIGAAAKELDDLRTAWLNPPEWTRTEILEFPGSEGGPWAMYIKNGTVRYPRLVPKDEECAKELKKRTLTNLYNQRPTWLDLAHQKLDTAVFAAYGWPVSLSDDDLLARLLELNLQRAEREKKEK